MLPRFVSHISFGFIIFFALITVIYELSTHKTNHKPTKIYPYFADIKHDIEKIDIRFPDKTLNLNRTDKGWVVTSAENFVANTQTIENLFSDIETMILITKKTQNNKDFGHLTLLNPTEHKVLDGEGIRFTLYGKNKTPYADFIIGERLKSYTHSDNIRLFVRYGTTGGAYLAQANSDFQYRPSHFLDKNFGMPLLHEIISAELIIKKEQAFKIFRIIDKHNQSEILFSPSQIPTGKKLIYPMVMRDYMVALTQQLRPLDAMYLPLNKTTPDTQMVLELTQGKMARITFWQVKNNSYMRIHRMNMHSNFNDYIYQIASSDYETLVQPLSRFLTDEQGTAVAKKNTK